MRGIYCAPGTWQSGHLPESEQTASNFSINPDYYFVGGTNAVNVELSRLAGVGAFGDQRSFSVQTRAQILLKNGVSANEFFGDRTLLLLVPFVLGLVLAGRLATWSGAVSRALTRSGVPALPMRRTVTATACGGVLVSSLAGGMVGTLIAFAVRPLLMATNGGSPLSPWRLSVGDLLLVAVVGLAGVTLGLWIGDASAGLRLRQYDHTAKPLGRVARTLAVVLSVAFAAGSLALIIGAPGRLWWLVGGALLMVCACAGLTPLAICGLGAVLSRRSVSSATLAGRLLVENSRRWGMIVVSVSLVLGVVCSLFTVSASSIAGQVALEASPVPPGSARIEVQNFGGDRLPGTTQAQFESDLVSTSPPLSLTELGVGPYGKGLLQGVATVDDARRLLGDLPAAAVAVLEQGGALTIGQPVVAGDTMPVQLVSFGEDDNAAATIDIPTTSIRPDRAHRYAMGGWVRPHTSAAR
ncbi:MAG: hypothetical protein LBV06_08255 [Propionibacteriaceae bacterium]|nr:hypothetical protein [Propionibacteriaceae bacterium]